MTTFFTNMQIRQNGLVAVSVAHVTPSAAFVTDFHSPFIGILTPWNCGTTSESASHCRKQGKISRVLAGD